MIRVLSYLVNLLFDLVAATNPDTTDIIRYQNGHGLHPNCVTFSRDLEEGRRSEERF